MPLHFLLVARALVPGEMQMQAVEIESTGRVRIAETYRHDRGNHHRGKIDEHDHSLPSLAEDANIRHIIRSDAVLEPDLEPGLKPGPSFFGKPHPTLSPGDMEDQVTKATESAVAAGVAVGACKNFRKIGMQDVVVVCPKPLKMVGCSCRDKEGEKTGACATKFSGQAVDSCNAFTKPGHNVTAYIRCCHMDWADRFTARLSHQASNATDGAESKVECEEGESLLGCACVPEDAPNNGCKDNVIQEKGCLATNLENHTAGVRAQALCGVLPNSSDWETVVLDEEEVENHATDMPCTKPFPELQMLSCSCGSSTGKCSGGKVINNRCECFGENCFASARCANIPVPPRDCIWNHWGEWSDCSTSCGAGWQTRIREIAMLARDGGAECTGSINETVKCVGDSTYRECEFKRKAKVVHAESHNELLLIIPVIVGALVLGGGLFAVLKWKNYVDEKKAAEEGLSVDHGGGYAGPEY